MAYGAGQGEIPFRVGKDIKAGWINDIREQTLIHKFAGKTDLAKRKGDEVEITKKHVPPPNTTPLEGDNEPERSQTTYEKLNFKLKRYSTYFDLKGHIIKTHEDDLFNMAMEDAKDTAARTVETLGSSIIQGGSQAFFSTGTQTSNVKDYLRKGLMDVQHRYLEVNEAPRVSKMFKSTSDWGTESLDACYITLCSPELAEDFRNLPGFILVKDYSSRVTPMLNEIGTYGLSRVCTSSFLKPELGAGAALSGAELTNIINTGGNADVFKVITFGAGAFDFGGLQGEDAVDLTVYNARPTDTDKNGNKGHISWLAWFGGIIKEQDSISRIECVAKTDAKLAV